MKIVGSETDGISSTALREIVLLRSIEHQNVIPLLDIVMDSTKLMLIFELMDCDLKKYLEAFPDRMPLHCVQVYFFASFIFFFTI